MSLLELLRATEGARIVQVGPDGSDRALSRAELAERASRALRALRGVGGVVGTKVLLLVARGEHFLDSFWGALAGGMIPVPVALPAGTTARGGDIDRIIAVWRKLGAPIVLIDPLFRDALDALAREHELRSLAVLTPEYVGEPDRDWHSPALDDLAFLQFSSGSTGAPKGVELTHRNVLANIEQVSRATRLCADDVVVSWMPYTHDMGLVGTHLCPLFVGATQVKLDPLDFVANPALWFETAHRHRGTVLATANFALGLAIKRIDDATLRTWDLSRVRLIGNGGEPVSPKLCRAFFERFAATGLRADTMVPMYGLAEATLGVAIPDSLRTVFLSRRALEEGRIETTAAVESDPTEHIELVDVGPPLEGIELRIVPEGAVGEVHVRGPNVTHGYFGEERNDGWLRTGDLGALIDGRLVITGRAKDVIIAHGRKLFAHDIEAIAESVSGVRAGKACACGFFDAALGEERAILFVATTSDDDAILDEVDRKLRAVLGLELERVVRVDPGAFPKTTSGKLQRYKMRDAFLAGRMRSEQAKQRDLAIVAMACRFPGASTPEAFWDLLANGREAVSDVPRDRFVKEGARGGFLDDVAAFDAEFFGIAADEAAAMDPQHRLLLEISYEALERGGYAGKRRDGLRVGVFVGAGSSEYGDRITARVERGAEIHPTSAVGNLRNMIAARVAHQLDLRGPALVVDTACSSALVALHLARESLGRGECDVALVGGVSLNLTATPYVFLGRAGALSPRGRCHAFDESADGFVPGEGAGVVVVKRLADAERDGDTILAIVRGTAINNDGRSIGPMAPSVDGQEAVLRDAWRDAELDPASATYVEAHGTGTAIGDPIEARSLARVLGPRRSGPLLVGSVKTNIGHLLAGAAIASIIKVVLAMRHRALPPSLHCTTPRRDLGPVEVVTTLRSWNGTLRAGVDAFGFGGTNAHAILDAAEPREVQASSRAFDVLMLSAPNEVALDARVASVTALPDLHELCDEAAEREEHAHRWAAVVRPAVAPASRDIYRGVARRGRSPKIAFVFAGQGAQYPGQGHGLFNSDAAFRARFTAAAKVVSELSGPDLLDACYAADDATMRETRVAQPLLVGFELTLARMLIDHGVRPDAVVGHSVGELAAAAIAGALDDREALRIATVRGALMDGIRERGTMAAVFAPLDVVEAEVAQYAGEASVAAINAPNQIVIAGSVRAVDAITTALEHGGFATQRLAVSHAFHSPLVAPVRDALKSALGASRRRPTLRFISTVTGAPLDELDASYWVEHAERPVLFARAIEQLRDEGYDAFVEIGPGATLAGSLRILLHGHDALSTSVLRRGDDDHHALSCALAQLWVRGVRVERHERPATRRLPPHPFARTRHWIEREQPSARVDRPLLRRRTAITLERATYEAEFEHRDPLVRDHVVLGVNLLPASACFELALEAASDALGRAPAALVATTFRRPLDVAANERRSLTVTIERGAELRFAIRDRDDVLGEGIVDPGPAIRERLDVAAIRARCPERMSPDELYRMLHAHGMCHGPTFQRVKELAIGERESLARLEPIATGGAHVIDPALGDAAVQGVAALLRDRNALFIPFAIERIAIAAPVTAACLAYTRLVSVDDEVVRCDVAIVTDAGEVLARLSGLSLKRARALSVSDRWMHVVTRVAAQATNGAVPSSVSIVGTLDGLVERLQKHGVRVTNDAEYVIDVRGCSAVELPRAEVPRKATLVVTRGDEPDRLAWHVFARGVGEERGDVRALHVRDDDPVSAIVAELGGRERAVISEQGRFVPSLERVTVDDRSPYRRGGHYLITGGGSGLGLAIARDLVARFDARISIFGRSERGELPGSYHRVDVADPIATERAVRAAIAEHGPIEGVFHAAGILQSGLAADTRLDDVFAPKARGAENLMAALREQRPSFVAFFSSVSAALPELSGGVAAYAAANAWLDAYAQKLRAEGLPVVSIAWGPWGETGMGATEAHRAIVERNGMRPIPTAEGVRACERAVASGRASIVVVARDAPRARPEVLPATLKEPPLEGDLEHVVRVLVARATRVRPEDIGPDESLLSLGLESLAAVEIVKKIESRIGRRVPTTLFFEHPTIRRAVAALEGLAPAATPSAPSRASSEYALSPTQRALIIGEDLDPSVPPYSFLRVTLRTPIDRQRLTSALAGVIARHPSLRTVIVDRERQRVLPSAPIVIDDVADEAEFRLRPFDRNTAPLFRFGVAGCDLLLVGHHAVADAWSLAVLALDVVALYQGRTLPSLASTPADLLEATARNEDLAFFRQRLASPPPSFLPEATGNVRVHEVRFERALTARLRARAAELSVSFFALLLAAHARFARRIGATDDVILQVANARREARVPDAEAIVGGFADTLPVRVRASDDVATIQEALTETLRHGSVSSFDLARVVERRPSLSLSFASFPLAGDDAIVDVAGSTAGPNTVLGAAAWEFDGCLRFAWSARLPNVAQLAAEHRAVLEELARSDEPEQVHLRFLRIANATPDATAIDRWTYAEVERATRAVARGVTAGSVVGVRMQPSAEATIAIIGILRAGAAWLPLDPGWPDARQQQSRELASASLVLDEDEVRTLIRRDSGAPFVDVACPPDALAYVMFTSGSTGVPKKVEITRGAVARFIDATLRWFDYAPSDRFVQTASLAFDSSVRQMFSPLCAGATLLPLPRDLLHAPDELARFLVRERITVWTSVPSLFGRVVAAADADSSLDLPLRWILLGGEALNASLVRRYFDRFGTRAKFANVYGPTETTVAVTCQVIDARPADDVVQIPIGRSIGTADVRVMRDDGAPCAVGEIGEIRIRGPVVARGLGPEYRTGDLGRLREDGAIEFCGRADRQVKIRGFRVELGEIENAIEAEAGVARAVVELSGEKLRAHVEGDVDANALRAALSRKLPPFMVPHEIVVAGELPRMTSGKIDRAALAEDPRLETIRAAFADVLGCDAAVDDDFFALGGDSILALELFARLRTAGLAVPRAAEIFRHRTPRALARLIPEATTHVESAREAPLSGSQVGFWLARAPANWCATIELRGPLDVDRLRVALRTVSARHPMLRTGVFSTPDGPRQRIVDCVPALDVREGSVAEILEQERRHRFALDRPPLVRFTLVRLEPERYVWIATAHHIIGDAWSGRLFARELFAAYDSRELPPEPSTTFLDIASTPRAPRREALEYWERTFAKHYDVPRVRTRDDVATGTAQMDADALLAGASSRGVTPFALLATAWARRLAAVSRKDDLVFGIATSGRDLPIAGVENVFGPFAHGLPVRVHVEGDFAQTLAIVDRGVRETLENDAPLDAIAARIPRLPGTFAPVAAQFFFTYVDADTLPRVDCESLGVTLTHSAAEVPGDATDLVLSVIRDNGTLTLRVDGRVDDPGAHARALVEELTSFLALPRVRTIASAADLGPIDAALISYLPSPAHLAEMIGVELPREQVRALLFPGGRARRADRVTTPLGATSTFLIPRFGDELASEGLAEEVLAAAADARACGARMISLAGMIPSRLAYGARLGEGFTTGHATTLVAVVKTLETVHRGGRSYAWLGVGSIGQGSLELALAVLPHPASITLCDLPSTHERLRALSARIVSEGYRGAIRVASPDVLHQDAFDVIVAATSAPDVLDIDRVAPGTIVLDDSFPPCFDIRRARARMATKRDLLATGAGLLDCGPIERTVALPDLGTELTARVARAIVPHGLPGCQLESLLLVREPSLSRTVGLVDVRDARAYWDVATRLGLRAAPYRCGDELVDPTLITAELSPSVGNGILAGHAVKP